MIGHVAFPGVFHFWVFIQRFRGSSGGSDHMGVLIIWGF